jgi:hypothetical protein
MVATAQVVAAPRRGAAAVVPGDHAAPRHPALRFVVGRAALGGGRDGVEHGWSCWKSPASLVSSAATMTCSKVVTAWAL